ncbi:DNA polymerase III subunit delta [Candidatus Parcubacteria bacterium 4484_255]|nr:MAG: DNA polymerase III subunit delta [Candidatus Parcubacteria bacterium 4484_255]
MIIFLYGADTYRSFAQLSLLKKKFTSERSQSNLNISSLSAPGLKIEKFRQAILSSGLFSKKRMVIVQNLLSKEASASSHELIRGIMNVIKNIRESKKNILIFRGGEIKEKDLSDAQKKLFTILKKEKFYPEFRPLTKGKLKIWIEKFVKQNKMTIENQAVDYIINALGNNLWAIKNELDKLIVGLSGGQIQLQDAKNLIKPTPEQNIWSLINAFGQKNKKLASQLLLKQIEAGMTTDYIISMLNYQYKIIIRMKSYVGNKSGYISLQQAAKDLSLRPFVCQKALQQQQNYELKELKKIYQQLLKIDILKKTRQINAEILLNLLILKN